jgi:hypothetical protein
MGFGGFGGRSFGFSALAVGAAVLAGCQSDNAADALNVAPPAAGEVRQSDLRAFCPPLILQEGTSRFSSYERGAKDDPARLVYQASIGDVTRSCSHNGGVTTVTVAVAGRIVPGPKGKTGTVNLPIRIVMLANGAVDAANTATFQHPVQVGDTVGATQFIFTRTGYSFPSGVADIQLIAGYDEGPPPRRR